MKKLCGLGILFLIAVSPTWAWGFFAHKQINRYAITTLPPAMFPFYKAHLVYLTEKAVNPDKRRYTIQEEASNHFIDLEYYVWAAKQKMTFKQAVAQYGMAALIQHGQLPWAIVKAYTKLVKAFKDKDFPNILKYSADLGHYVADAHVPLHTTEQYDGQMTHQEGIHALWETQLPLLFFDTYTLWVGQAHDIQDPLLPIWAIIGASHALVPTVLTVEQQLTTRYPTWLKYSFQQEGSVLKKNYSIEFATLYHQSLQGQVEERLCQSVRAVGSFWFSAWLKAGAPTLEVPPAGIEPATY
ncbi:MAG: zinc dependent phospholipase C family protein [Candidatus Cardinium sp.]|nr:zinc dependent phospholipase C family protein [Candidatus Cardinium sp.]